MRNMTIDLAGAPDDVPVLLDDVADGMALPEGAVRNADGTVALTLAYPATITFKLPGGPEVKQDTWHELVFHRLTGADMRQVIAAKGARAAQLALARSIGLSAARVALLYAKMDASDVTAANAVVAALCGFDGGEELPDSAVVGDDGAITLPLGVPAEPDGGELRHELVFRRLRGDDLIAISIAKDVLQMAMSRSTGLTLKDANAVFDAMDAADIMAMQRVISFLSGSGRRSGG